MPPPPMNCRPPCMRSPRHPTNCPGWLNHSRKPCAGSSCDNSESSWKIGGPGTTMRAPNGGFRYLEQIGSAESGRTVLAHLSHRHPLASEAEWLNRIDSGQVLFEDRPA